TTREDVLGMCGTEVEEEERTGEPDRSVLVYRGWRAEPETRQRMRWVATVEAWAVLAQEVRVEIARGLVKDVQVRIRRSRGPTAPLRGRRPADPCAARRARGVPDGLPVGPPTAARVAAAVEASGRSRDELIGLVAPRLGRATVEKIAVNAVMAGCRAEYLP